MDPSFPTGKKKRTDSISILLTALHITKYQNIEGFKIWVLFLNINHFFASHDFVGEEIGQGSVAVSSLPCGVKKYHSGSSLMV